MTVHALKTKTPEAYTVEMKSADKIFGLELGIEVPFFTWKEPNDNIPKIDPKYQFNVETLLPVLWALKTGRKAWLHGHTGTGKSTLIDQVCANLNWPLMRVNFDSEITRMDLIGRDVLDNDGGVTKSRFVDGILPQAIAGPNVLLCDEVDFVRPDVSYVFQRALEDAGILITEDGGRLVKPHPMSRIVATGNTQGQGDDHGIYQGARAQSLAFLDRFTVWVSCEYLKEEQEKKILRALVPDLGPDRMKEVLSYVKEHRQAFLSSKIMQPLSPRGIIAFAEAILMYEEVDKKSALRNAAKCTILDKANPADASVIKGIVDRIETVEKVEEDPKKKASSEETDYKKIKAEVYIKAHGPTPPGLFSSAAISPFTSLGEEEMRAMFPSAAPETLVGIMKIYKTALAAEREKAVAKTESDIPF